MSSVLGFLWDTFFAKLVYEPAPNLLTGRIAIVTGSNVGLGFETAVHLGKLDPARLIIACRSLAKGRAARDKVLARTGLGAERVEVWELDLASFASVKAFARRVNDDLPRLDILCQNAGIATSNFTRTGDGFESTIQVNGLATGLLALLTLEKVAGTAELPVEAGMKPFKPHSTIVGSEVHAWTTFKRPAPGTPLLANLNDPHAKNAPMADRYNLSKLISLFLARQISRLPAARGVVVDVVNPGLCVSELRSEMSQSLVGRLLDSIAYSAEEGSKNIALASIADVAPGGFVSYTRINEPTSPFSNSDEGLLLEHDLWEEMVAEWIKVAPEVKDVLA